MVRYTRIPKPPEMDRAYLNAYFSNRWKRMTRQPVDKSLTGRCVGCGLKGVLGTVLVHRGPTRPTNLLCKDCAE